MNVKLNEVMKSQLGGQLLCDFFLGIYTSLYIRLRNTELSLEGWLRTNCIMHTRTTTTQKITTNESLTVLL